MMNEMDRAALDSLNHAYMSEGIAHAAVAAAVISVVEEYQFARAWFAFVNGAVFLHVPVNGFDVIFGIIFKDTAESHACACVDGAHGSRTIGAKLFGANFEA